MARPTDRPTIPTGLPPGRAACSAAYSCTAGAAIHLGLAAMAINLALAARATDEDRQVRDWTAWVLGQPFGRLLIMMLGVGIALGGIALGAKAIAGDFRSKLPRREPETGWIVMLGRAGFAARGFVFVLVGAFLSMVLRSAAGHRRGGCRTATDRCGTRRLSRAN
jgi:Domain of Unknown Function (DUF1206)